MSNMLENYGLEFFRENEDSLLGLAAHIAENGKSIKGYYGLPYIFHSMGDVEFYLKTESTSDGKLSIEEFDTHKGNMCAWEMECKGIDITPKSSSKLARTVMVSDYERGGFLPIELINADVLPSFLDGDKITMQVVAHPLEINYYANQQEYEDAQPESKDGEKWFIDNGTLAPIEFLYNHNPDRYEQGKDYETDTFVQFVATVDEVYHGVFEFNGEKHNTFISCFVNTKFGMLEFAHTEEHVPEELRKNIKPGAIVSGVCVISGDVAIKEYENGIIKDFDNNLKLLRYTLVKGDPERLASVLTEDAIYETETSGTKYSGHREIIDRFKYVHQNRQDEYLAYFATITKTDGSNLEYPVGTRCIVLATEEDKYESIAFIDIDKTGMITRIKICTDSRYHFSIEK